MGDLTDIGLMGITISNIVMFGKILAVDVLADGAIVAVEYVDRRIAQGSRATPSVGCS